METRFDHRSLQIGRDDMRRHTTQKGKSTDVAADPVWQALAPCRFDIREVRRPKGRDEDLGCAHFARLRADDIDSVSCAINKQPFARRVPLTHDRRQASFPQQRQCHPLAPQFRMHVGPIRLRDGPRRCASLMRKQAPLQINI